MTLQMKNWMKDVREKSSRVARQLDEATEDMRVRQWVEQGIVYAKENMNPKMVSMFEQLLSGNMCTIDAGHYDLRPNQCGLAYQADLIKGKLKSSVALPRTVGKWVPAGRVAHTLKKFTTYRQFW